MQRTATARWNGSLKEGSGTLSAPGGVLNQTPYSFKTRFENTAGTNPEELIAAAHAGCFSMAFSAMLGGKNITPRSIETTARLSLEQQGGGWEITAIHLATTVDAPGASEQTIRQTADEAKAGCPVSKVLKAAITLETTVRA